MEHLDLTAQKGVVGVLMEPNATPSMGTVLQGVIPTMTPFKELLVKPVKIVLYLLALTSSFIPITRINKKRFPLVLSYFKAKPLNAIYILEMKQKE